MPIKMMLFGAQVVEVERVGDEAVIRDVHVEKKNRVVRGVDA